MNIRAFWIRRDRETYFLTGVILACSVGGFVSSYWHFTDRITVRQNIKLRETAPTKTQQSKLREVQYTPTKLRSGATQYYRLDDYSKPSVPKMGEDYDE
ncbi:MAG: hypothetical protein PHV36_05475 [Elusimicrobiales bacterium]|nr:hypothetical protein [Elusimicrobiales bacterium]